MGTRADFYVSNLSGLEWLGSIAWNGYEIDEVSEAETEDDFRAKLEAFFSKRDDVTRPERGWPWPWNDSRLTDFAYVYVPDVGVVYRSGDDYQSDASDDGKCERYVSKRLLDNPPEEWVWDDYYGYELLASVEATYTYPDMRASKNVRFDAGSGIITVGAA